MKTSTLVFTSLSLAAMLGLSACDTPEGIGAMAGAGAGAIIGGTHGHHALEGAAIGAASGALLGHLIGRADSRGYYEGERLPYGRRVGRGLVESPYRPHNLVDTRGIPHGAVVEDPSTGGRFINP
jgi:predicted small secreted protein